MFGKKYKQSQAAIVAPLELLLLESMEHTSWRFLAPVCCSQLKTNLILHTD